MAFAEAFICKDADKPGNFQGNPYRDIDGKLIVFGMLLVSATRVERNWVVCLTTTLQNSPLVTVSFSSVTNMMTAKIYRCTDEVMMSLENLL